METTPLMNDVHAGLNISSILKRTFSILSQHLGLILPLALMASLPLEVLFPVNEGGRPSGSNGFILIFANLVLTALATGSIAWAVSSIVRGAPLTLGEAFKVAVVRGISIVLASLLMGLCLFGGFMLLIVPGVIVLCMLAVTLQACTLEGLKPLASLKRSRELTRGHRLSILALLFLAGLVALAAGLLVGIIGIFLPGDSPLFSLIIDCAIALPGMAFSHTMMAVIYGDLRSIKEGAGLDAAVRVFD